MKCKDHLDYDGSTAPTGKRRCTACRKIYAIKHRGDNINEVAHALGITRRAVQNYYAEAGLSSPTGSPGKASLSLDQTLEAKKQRDEMRGHLSFRSEASERIERLEIELQAVRTLQGAKSDYIIKPQHGTNTSEAVAVACATDWHLGSEVKPESVNGLNTYNAEIGKKRIESFFQKVVRMAEKERQDVKLEELVLFLGGDLIDGSLHDDSKMSQDISGPMNQAVFCQGLIEAGLRFLQNHGKFKRITVVCTDGNHSRITAKQHWASRKGNALEYYMYYNLAARFPELNWLIATGIHVYVDVFGYTLRFHHGDTISFGGVAGPYTYINRRVFQWNQARRADFDTIGHLHQYTVGTRKWLINGSLIGYTAYGQSLGGEFQPPIQAFYLYDKTRGPTIHIPIIL